MNAERANGHRTADGDAEPRPRRRADLAPALKRVASSGVAVAREHWFFLCLAAAGASLRAVAFFAYDPALFRPDSHWYLWNMVEFEPKSVRPLGYPAFLRLLPLESGLAVVPFVQHLFGLIMAVLVYAVLFRLGVWRPLAALATAPVLLDGYQLNIEEMILSDALFEFLVVGGCVLLLWRRPLGVTPAGLAGLLFAAAAVTRGIGLLLVVPAVLATLFLSAELRWRPRVVRAIALLALFALPVGGYMIWFHSQYGVYAITTFADRFLYARAASFADCTQFSVPQHERVLCPEQPVGDRPPFNTFAWSRKESPVFRVEPPPGMTRNEVAGQFARRAIRHQPLTYARFVASDFAYTFAPTKTTPPGGTPASTWQFQLTAYGSKETRAALRAYGDGDGHVDSRLAGFLRAYQRYGFTPGPVLAAGLIAGLLAALGLGRARRSGLRGAAFLFSGAALVVGLGSVAATHFSLRYQLPQLVLLPAALALGVTALVRRRDGEERASARAAAPGAASES